MANLDFSLTGITSGSVVRAAQVSQSIIALSGQEPYNVTISGSLNMTGSIVTGSLTGSFLGTGSYSSFALEASQSVSSSMADTSITSSYALEASESVSSSYAVSSSLADDAISSSYALSSSYSLRASAADSVGGGGYVWRNESTYITSSLPASSSQFWVNDDAGKVGSKIGIDNNTHIEFPNTTDINIKTSGGTYSFTQGTLNTAGNIEVNSGAAANGITVGNVTASVKVSSSTIEASGKVDALAFSASNGSLIATLGGNDLKFDRPNNTSYIHQIGAGGKLQLGIGDATSANANILISSSGNNNYGNTVQVGKGTLLAMNDQSPANTSEPVIISRFGPLNEVFHDTIKIKEQTTSATSTDIIQFNPTDLFGGSLKYSMYLKMTVIVNNSTFSQGAVFLQKGHFHSIGSGDPLIDGVIDTNQKIGVMTGTVTATLNIAGPGDNYIRVLIGNSSATSLTWGGHLDYWIRLASTS